MTSTQAKDFLTKELFINKNVVTYRSLSRELGIHVNDAKNELAAYKAESENTDAPSFATYMVSGLAPIYNDPQSVLRSKIVLAGFHSLQDAKDQFTTIHSVHVYSLSPSVFRDADLICEPTRRVREIDAKGNPALNGKIISAHVKARKRQLKPAGAASSSKRTLDAQKPVVSQSSVVVPRTSEQTTEKSLRKEELKDEKHAKALAGTKDQAKPTESSLRKEEPKDEKHEKSLVGIKDQAKPTGKLDWSKAKSKEQETTSRTHAKDKNKPQAKQDTKAEEKLTDRSSSKNDVGPQSKKNSIAKRPAPGPKRAAKRKSPDTSDSDANVEDQPTFKDEKTIPPAASNSRVKKGIFMSDDEDEQVPRKPRRKNAPVSGRGLEAMMDIDDDQVIRASRLSSRRPDDEVDDASDEVDLTDAEAPISSAVEEEEEEEEEPKPQPKKKRKPKKVVPVGRNGLKKRRVLKSRTATDAKGYMQTEDYSSYESVSEEEAVPEVAKKPKGKKKAETRSKGDAEENPIQAKSKTKEASSKAKGGKAPKRGGGLFNFFGPDKTKK